LTPDAIKTDPERTGRPGTLSTRGDRNDDPVQVSRRPEMIEELKGVTGIVSGAGKVGPEVDIGIPIPSLRKPQGVPL
jgi:hypothetical protein